MSLYHRIYEMRPYEEGEDMSNIVVPAGAVPKVGGMILTHYEPFWEEYIPDYIFKICYEPVEPEGDQDDES